MKQAASSVSLATIAGTLLGFALVIGAIMRGTNNYLSFLSPEGFLIVICGTIANAFMSYEAGSVTRAFWAMLHMIKKPKATHEGLNAEIMLLIKWAYIVSAKGFAGLENETGAKIKEPLLRYGLDLVISNYSSEQIRDMMNTIVEAEFERRITPVTVLRNMASTAPAFGMVGTLVGMVIMLQNIQGDMAQIGLGLSVALLATLYGIIMARILCLPAADKLLQKEEIMRFRNYMMTEGLVLLAEKENPRLIQDKLNSYLDPSQRFDLDSYLAKNSPQGRSV